MFCRILKKLSQTQEVKMARQIFQWLVVAKRPLTTEELREAVTIDPSKSGLDTSSLVNDMNQALACCGCFVVIDEEQETVHLAHHSIQRYLLSDPSDSTLAGYHVKSSDAEICAGEACVAYLNFDIFDRGIAKAPVQGTKIANIPTAITNHMITRNKLAVKIMALSLLANSTKDKKKMNSIIQRQLERTAHQSTQDHPFLAYASKWWIWHTKSLEHRNKRLWNMWCRLLTDESARVEKIWDPQSRPGHGLDKGILDWAMQNHHFALMKYMLFTSGRTSSQKEELVKSIVPMMVRNEERDFLNDFLSELSENTIVAFNYFYDKAQVFLLALWLGQLKIIRHYVGNGVSQSLFRYIRLSELHEAGIILRRQRFEIQKLNELAPLTDATMLDKWTPLSVAAASNQVHVVGYIISKSTDVLDLRQALLVSAAYNHTHLARSVLHQSDKLRIEEKVVFQHFFDVNDRDKNGWTALMYATAFSNLALIEQLLERGATFQNGIYNTSVGGWLTPIIIADITSRVDVRRLLVRSPN